MLKYYSDYDTLTLDMLEKEYKYYEKNKSRFLRRYPGKFLVIRKEKVIGAYDSEKEAYMIARSMGFEIGTFLIQECRPDSVLNETFHSRVVFNQ